MNKPNVIKGLEAIDRADDQANAPSPRQARPPQEVLEDILSEIKAIRRLLDKTA